MKLLLAILLGLAVVIADDNVDSRRRVPVYRTSAGRSATTEASYSAKSSYSTTEASYSDKPSYSTTEASYSDKISYSTEASYSAKPSYSTTETPSYTSTYSSTTTAAPYSASVYRQPSYERTTPSSYETTDSYESKRSNYAKNAAYDAKPSTISAPSTYDDTSYSAPDASDSSYTNDKYSASKSSAPTSVYENVYDAPRPFRFSYAVKDDITYNDHSHQQQSDGKVVTGSYRVHLPDGRIQVVTYKADDYGYVADVKYETGAKYPEYNAKNQEYKAKYPAPVPTEAKQYDSSYEVTKPVYSTTEAKYEAEAPIVEDDYSSEPSADDTGYTYEPPVVYSSSASRTEETVYSERKPATYDSVYESPKSSY